MAQGSKQAALVIMAETEGRNPGAIVGRGNLVRSEGNPHAFVGLPSQPDRAPDVQQRELNWSDKSAPSPRKPPGPRGYRGTGGGREGHGGGTE